MQDQAVAFSSGDPAAVSADEAEARASLILGLRRRGIASLAVLSAIERVPRRLFLSARHHRLAYEDASIPIECGQIVSAPSYVARVAELLELTQESRVLEIGTGSGYQAAVLGHLAGEVESLERYRTLVELASQRTAAVKLRNVRIHHADGFKGLSENAPFDRIVLTGSVETVPEILTEQLAPGGILVAPIGPAGQPQTLTRLRRTDNGIAEEQIDPNIRLVALTKGLAEKL